MSAGAKSGDSIVLSLYRRARGRDDSPVQHLKDLLVPVGLVFFVFSIVIDLGSLDPLVRSEGSPHSFHARNRHMREASPEAHGSSSSVSLGELRRIRIVDARAAYFILSVKAPEKPRPNHQQTGKPGGVADIPNPQQPLRFHFARLRSRQSPLFLAKHAVLICR